MHAVDLASLTSSFASCSAALCNLPDSVVRPAVQDYWLTNRFRHENWIRSLAAHRHAIQESGVSFRSNRWHEILPVIQEVLLSEPLARCMAYHAKAADERRSAAVGMSAEGHAEENLDSEFTTLAFSALAAHKEARHRCLHLIVFGPGLSVEHAVRLNRLRRAMEEFSDRLLSAMQPIKNMEAFAFNMPAVVQSQSALATASLHNPSVDLHLRGTSRLLWRTIEADVDWRIANARLNYKLSQNVLGLLPPHLFDSWGVIRSTRQVSYLNPPAESPGSPNDMWSNASNPVELLFNQQRSLRDHNQDSSPKPRW